MKKTHLISAAAVMTAAAVAMPAAAQDKASSVGIGVSAGTLGIGPEINWRSDKVGVRGSATFFGLGRDVDSDGVTYNGDLKLRSFGGTVDVYPGGGRFRISGGARISNNRVLLKAEPAATTTVEIGDVNYTGAQIGRLDGEVKANKFAPTLTIGFGSKAGSGAYFGFDAGAMFQGSPKVNRLTASGPIATNAAFQAELLKERAEIEDDISNFKVYPIVQLAIGFRF
jgi:hypothetical protein